MKKLLVLLMMLWVTANAQQSPKSVHNKNPKRNDTTFLLREQKKNFYHAVFIEHNRQSKYYKYLSNFTFDKYDTSTFKESYQQLKEKKLLPLKKYKLGGLPAEWVPLYLYKGKYYVYYPSEQGALGRRIITDSTMVYWWMDGPEIRPLQKVVKLSEGKFSLRTFSNYTHQASKLNIYIIDPKNKIAVFEDMDYPDKERYALYIPREAIKNFDVIVNYCETQKTDEFSFDIPDFKKLLAGT